MLRKVLVNLGLIAGSVLFALCLVGLGLRLHDGVPLLEFKNFARDSVDQFTVVRSLMYDDRLGWRPKPGLHLAPSINGVVKTETTDVHGNRITGEANSGIATGGVLASGDSFTYGADVGDAETWPAFLENMIGVPVTNASSRGWGTDQIVMRVEDMVDLIRPRTLILGVYWRDIQRAELEINYGAYKPHYTIEGGNLVLRDVPVPRLSASVHDLGLVRAVLGYSYIMSWVARRLGLWSPFDDQARKQATPSGTGEKVSCLLLRRLKERAQDERMRLMLVMIYGNFDFVQPQPSTAIAVLGCARELGYDTIDTWTTFATIFAEDQPRFRSLYVFPDTWSHMSGAGNRLVAAALAQRLRETEASEVRRP